MNDCECPVCKSKASHQFDGNRMMNFYECPVCGRFELNEFSGTEGFNMNHLTAYLVYHSYKQSDWSEYRYNTVLDKEECDRYKKEFQSGHNICGLPVHMDADIVNSWYPRSLAEKVDSILLYIDSHAKHLGQKIQISLPTLMGVLFVDRYDIDNKKYGNKINNAVERDEKECIEEIRYMLDYLKKSNLIECQEAATTKDMTTICLTPLGYQRVDELQKNSSYGRSVLVAMKFGDDTAKLREAIRKGISDAYYYAVFIDEVQHNDFITPELLKHIRDSKFVVVDLTHQNNGAYFEEGYAMGLGKQVIQLCRKDVSLHFDIAQKNTIMWETEEDISERLTNRIRATID